MSATVEKSFALIGACRSSRRYLDAARDLPELSASALVDAHGGALARTAFAELPHYATVAEMLRAGVPDVAIVCCPPGDRMAVCGPLLRAGVDLLVEAPLATRASEAEELLELAERTGRELTTAIPMRLAPAVERVRVLLEAGAVGTLRRVEVNLANKRSPRGSWRADPARAGGGVWMQLGPEALDLLSVAAGPVQGIRMCYLGEQQGCDVEDEAKVETEHRGGVAGSARVSWNGERTLPLLQCSGDEGELLVGDTQTILRRDTGDLVVGPGLDQREACVATLTEHLRRRCSLHTPIETGADTVQWIEAAYQSFRDQAWRRQS
jgi:predicted dehydrogenase